MMLTVLYVLEIHGIRPRSWKVVENQPNGCRISDPRTCFRPLHTLSCTLSVQQHASHCKAEGGRDECSWSAHWPTILHFLCFFKPPVGAGGGYVFSGRPSVPPFVRVSVIHVVVLCFHDISSICWRIFVKLLSLVHLGTDELIRFWGQKVKVQGHGMTEYIPDFHVSAISPVSVDGFSPNFCHWCILGQRWPDYVFGSKGQSSRSRHPGGGAKHSTLSSSATFSSLSLHSLTEFWTLLCTSFWLSDLPDTSARLTMYSVYLQLSVETC